MILVRKIIRFFSCCCIELTGFLLRTLGRPGADALFNKKLKASLLFIKTRCPESRRLKIDSMIARETMYTLKCNIEIIKLVLLLFKKIVPFDLTGGRLNFFPIPSLIQIVVPIQNSSQMFVCYYREATLKIFNKDDLLMNY